MGRPRKPAAQHKLEGTYIAVRHENSPEAAIAKHLEVPAGILPPDTITDPVATEHYRHHLQLLVRLNILTLSDIPEINMMYEALQEYRRLYAELQKADPVTDIERYEILSNRVLKFGQRFSTLASRYYISPVARTRLTLETLQINKEVQEQKSITAKLIGSKKA
jgi:phage terminase small subunit